MRIKSNIDLQNDIKPAPDELSVGREESSDDRSTVVDEYQPRETSSPTTTDDGYIQSSLKLKQQRDEITSSFIQEDKEKFRSLISSSNDITQKLAAIEETIEDQNDAYLFFNRGFKALITPPELPALPTVDEIIETYEEKRIASKTVNDIYILLQGDLEKVFNKLTKDLSERIDRFNTIKSNHNDLVPKTALGRFLQTINKTIRHFFGGQTALEKIEALLEKQQNSVTSGIQSMRLIVATAQIHKNEILSDQDDIKREKAELIKEQHKNTASLVELAKQYRIPMNADLSIFEDNAMAVFDGMMTQKDLSDNEEKIIKRLIERCYTLFTSTEASNVRMGLKAFLKHPTQENLLNLKSVMQNNPDYIRDQPLVALLKEAQVLYTDIPSVPLVKISTEKLNQHFEPQIISLVEDISALEAKRKTRQANIQQDSPQLLETRIAAQENTRSLEKCQDLLLLARLHEKDDDATLLPHAKGVVAYLKSKIAFILSNLPEEEEIKAKEILSRDKKTFNLNYDICRKDIKNIFREFGIQVPNESITLDKIKKLYAHLDKETQKSILSEINSLEPILSQAKILSQESSKEAAVVLNCMIDERNKTLEIDNAIRSCELIDDENWDIFNNLFKTFEAESLENPPRAFDNLEKALMQHRQKYPHVFENILSKIQNARESYTHINDLIEPIKSISATDMASLETARRDTASQLKEIDVLDAQIRQLELQVEEVKQVRDHCILVELAPPQILPGIQTIIDDCKRLDTRLFSALFGSGDNMKRRIALANFLAIPTEEHLKKLHESMKDPAAWVEKDSGLKNLIQIASTYYPRITEGIDLSLTSQEQATTGPKTQESKTKLQAIKASEQEVPRKESAVDAPHHRPSLK